MMCFRESVDASEARSVNVAKLFVDEDLSHFLVGEKSSYIVRKFLREVNIFEVDG